MKIRKPLLATFVTVGVLSTVIGFALLRPSGLSVESAEGGVPAAPSLLRIEGVVRDFSENHPDFETIPNGGTGHYAGNVRLALGFGGVPVYAGALYEDGEFNAFDVVHSEIVPERPFAAMVTVLGAAIQRGTQDLPVTARVRVGNQTIDPFGPFDRPRVGNVNLYETPRRYIIPRFFLPYAHITVQGASWDVSGTGSQDSDYTRLMSFDSDQNTPMVKVLKDGDQVPDIPGFQDQSSIEEFIADYIADGKVALHANQVICLFELGESDLSSPAADFQDLVLLITLAHSPEQLTLYDTVGNLIYDVAEDEVMGYKVTSQWHDTAGNPIAPHLYTDALGDVPGARGVESSGGIKSIFTFAQWFRDALGVNLSTQHTIELEHLGGGVYEYSTDQFHPIDTDLLGNEGYDHNYDFTYTFTNRFVYESGGGQFFEFGGADDAWLFVNGQLVMDRGGVLPPSSQFVDMDRLGLVDGEEYDVRFFYAQRQRDYGGFHLRTNIFSENIEVPELTVTGGYD